VSGQPALRAVPSPRSVRILTIRWFTDADREGMRNARHERRDVDELELAEAWKRPLRDVPMPEAMFRMIDDLQIDPSRPPRD
jgi:hypothetical protein